MGYNNLLPVGLLLAILGFCHGVSVKSCSKNAADNKATVNWVNAAPKPITVPGDLSLGLSVTLDRAIDGNLDFDITISRLFGLIWIDLPCVNTRFGRLGSCSYSNVCGILNRLNGTTCPRFLSDNNIPCKCPIPAGTYTIPNTIIPLDLNRLGVPLPSVSGEYQASIRVTDRDTLQEIICYDIDVTIADPQSQTTFGNIGRFLVNLFG